MGEGFWKLGNRRSSGCSQGEEKRLGGVTERVCSVTAAPIDESAHGGRVTNLIKTQLNWPNDFTVSGLRAAKQRMVARRSKSRPVHASITIASKPGPLKGGVSKVFFTLPINSFWIHVPFFCDDEANSALGAHPMVETLIDEGQRRGWLLRREPIDLVPLGFDKNNLNVDVDVLFASGNLNSTSISVVTPMYNCAFHLPYFVKSLLCQEVNEPFELILVDDGSTDESIQVGLQSLLGSLTKHSFQLLRRQRTKPYRNGTFSFSAGLARQLGVSRAIGQRILFLDPDQFVEPGCLQEHVDWGRRGFDVVIGDRRTDDVDVFTDWSRLRTAALCSERHWWLSFFTGNASVDRQLLDSVGGFDPCLQYWGLDDTDLGYRLFRAGASIWHTPRALVSDLAPDDSGAGPTTDDRNESYRLHMEVLYRKDLDKDIHEAFQFLWPASVS
jgi:glycosyltransferase involved in cell wall biosynthesis